MDVAGTYTYADLLEAARQVAASLRNVGVRDGVRVVALLPPGFSYVALQWGTWLAGGIAVPLAPSHPDPEISYVLGDSGAAVAVGTGTHTSRLRDLGAGAGLRVYDATELTAVGDVADLQSEFGNAMLLYTSGTTGRAKGVVWRHEAIRAQVEIMSDAWGWQPDDRALLVLPLHHVHGLINVVTTALWNGATVEMHEAFDAAPVWDRLGSGDITVFMAVPTIYHRLLAAWQHFTAKRQAELTTALSGMRLMVSGSAALPVATLEAWRRVSGHTLLERYGMTEIGMALSNPYEGDRVAGTVGMPLPTVETRVVDERDEPVREGSPGRLQVRGPSVFRSYWERPDATAASFVDDWFRTGDIVQVEAGRFRILGRESVDIIKSGGEKVSALEIEDVLRRHPAVDDCAVVGIPDAEWGELVAVAVVAAGPNLDLAAIRDFCRAELAPAKIPRRMQVVAELPRNALGKVMKPDVKALWA